MKGNISRLETQNSVFEVINFSPMINRLGYVHRNAALWAPNISISQTTDRSACHIHHLFLAWDNYRNED